METFEKITKKYAGQMGRYDTARNKLDTQITELCNKMTTLESQKSKLQFPRWTEKLLQPVLAEIKKQLPDYVCERGQLTPLGLGCRVSVFFYKRGLSKNSDKWAEGNSIYMVFMPGDLGKGQCYMKREKRPIVLNPIPSVRSMALIRWQNRWKVSGKPLIF